MVNGKLHWKADVDSDIVDGIEWLVAWALDEHQYDADLLRDWVKETRRSLLLFVTRETEDNV